jgi:hypothetical protein
MVRETILLFVLEHAVYTFFAINIKKKVKFIHLCHILQYMHSVANTQPFLNKLFKYDPVIQSRGTTFRNVDKWFMRIAH